MHMHAEQREGEEEVMAARIFREILMGFKDVPYIASIVLYVFNAAVEQICIDSAVTSNQKCL